MNISSKKTYLPYVLVTANYIQVPIKSLKHGFWSKDRHLLLRIVI